MRMKRTPRPEDLSTPQARGQLLQWWIEQHYNTREEFLAETAKYNPTGETIGRTTLVKYVRGETDLLNLWPSQLEPLLGTMRMTDEEAREFFQVPEELHYKWRTFRPWPVGHGAPLRDPRHKTIRTSKPVKGEVQLPATGAGCVIEFVEGDRDGAILLFEMPDAFWTFSSAGYIPENQGTFLGSWLAFRSQ